MTFMVATLVFFNLNSRVGFCGFWHIRCSKLGACNARGWADYGLTGVWPILVRRRSGQVVHHEISDGRIRANNRDVVFHP